MEYKFFKMNNLRNSVQLIGNLGKAVTYRNFDSGSTKASFPLATNEYYKNNKGEKTQDTQWHNIVAWGKTAELMKTQLDKGSHVIVRGKLVSRSWDDEQGNKRYITEVVASDFISMGKKELPF